MKTGSPDPRIFELVQRWSEDSITDPEIQELEALLRADPNGPRLFAELTHLDHSLEALGSSVWEAGFQPPAEPARRRSRPTLPEAMAIAALLLLAVAVLGVLFPGTEPPNAAAESAPSAETETTEPPGISAEPSLPPTTGNGGESVALLGHSIGPEWEDAPAGLREGDSLPAGTLRLRSGLVQLQFFSGVKLVLEGPAVIDLPAQDVANCRRGRFYATIPRHAGSFVLRTPQGEVSDTGASFGLDLDPDGTSAIHVFDGDLVFRTPDPMNLAHLEGGQATHLDGDTSSSIFDADPSQFVTDLELKQWHALQRERALNEWYLGSLRWRRDPRLLAFYDFDSPDSLRGVVPALTAEPGLKETLEAVIVGAERTEGRWPGKTGYALNHPSHRIRIQIPGHYNALTLVTWVRPDDLDPKRYALLLSDGFDHGAVHWWIHGESSQLSFRTRRHREETALYQSTREPASRALQPGQWSQLACVYDRLQNRVWHYLDGAPAGSEPLQVNVRLRIGVAEIGNAADLTDPPEPFPGVIDEFAIYRASLSPEEIRAMYEAGRPR